MYDEKQILEAARTIRPLLVDLVGKVLAGELDGALAGLLADAVSGRKVDNLILDTVRKYPPAREWMRAYLGVGVAEFRGFQPTPGLGDPVSAPKYCCPQGDYTWYRRQVGESIPRCPTHKVELQSC